MSRSWEPARDISLPGGKPAVGPRVGRIAEVLTDQLIPAGGKIPLAPADTDCYAFLARYLRDQAPGTRMALKLLYVAFDLAPFLFIGRFSRFVNLGPEARELYIADWASSRIYYRRMTLVLLKTLSGMGYYNDPKVLEAIGYNLACGERNVS